MATISELNIRLGLLTKDFDDGLRSVENKLRASGRRLSSLGSDLTIAISAPLAAFGAAAITAAGDVESLRLAMRATFEGAGRSIAEADKELEALRKSALAPGLDFEQAVRGSVRLQNVGFSAEKARGIIEQLANTLATTGGTAQDLDEVVNQFSQMIGKGKIFQDDLKIIVGRMPKLAALMKETFGTTTAEGLNALGVDARTFVDTMVAKMSELPRVSGGIKNSIVNAGSAVRNFLASIGEEINKAFDLGKLSDELSVKLGNLANWFRDLDDGTKKVIVEFGLALAAAGPLVKVFGALYGGGAQLIGVFRDVVKLSTPLLTFFAGMTQSTASVTGYIKEFAVGMLGVEQAAARMKLAVAAATGGALAVLLGIAGAVYVLSDRFDAASFAAEQFNKAQNTTIEQAAKETGELNKNFDVLRNVTSSTDDRKKAVAALQAAYPDYLKNIDLERASSADLTRIQKGLNDQILRGVAERQKAAAVNAIYEKQASILLRIQQIQRTGSVTAGEATLINTGDLIRNGSNAAAVIEKLQSQVKDLGTQANVTAKDFDAAFGLQSRSIDPLLEAEYKARQAAEDSRDALLGYGEAVKGADNATKVFSGSAGASKEALKLAEQKAKAYEKALRDIDAVVKKGDILGADVIGEQAAEIEKQIEHLLEIGVSEKKIQTLKDRLAGLREGLKKGVQGKADTFVAPTLPTLQPGAGGDVQSTADPAAGVLKSLDKLSASGDIIKNFTGTFNESMLSSLTTATQFRLIMQGIRDDTLSFSDAWTAMSEGVTKSGDTMATMALALGQGMVDAFDGAGAGSESFARTFVKSAAKIIGAAIRMAVAEAALSALQNTPYPYNLILAGVAGAAAQAIFQGLINKVVAPKLAGGGVLTKPTMFIGGEYPGATSNPEIVAPQRMLTNIFRKEAGGGVLEVTGILQGDNIYLASKRAEAKQNRLK